jgi:hypothetical protein
MLFGAAMNDLSARLKSAELLSIAGASVLGAGVALVLQRWLAPFAVAIALAGLIAHAGGMYQKHRIEAGAGLKVALRETWLYWFCWLTLALLTGFLLFQTFR